MKMRNGSNPMNTSCINRYDTEDAHTNSSTCFPFDSELWF